MILEPGHKPEEMTLWFHAMVKYFDVRFEDLFEIVLINPETRAEKILQPLKS